MWNAKSKKLVSLISIAEVDLTQGRESLYLHRCRCITPVETDDLDTSNLLVGIVIKNQCLFGTTFSYILIR